MATEATKTVADSGIELSKQLRQAIASGHDQAEETGLAKAIANATVTKDSYTRLLQELYHVHNCLEKHMQSQSHLQAFAHESQYRLSHIENDLASFGIEPKSTMNTATESLVQKLNEWASSRAILGALYILEGSRMGSRVLGPKLAEAFDREAKLGLGLDYHIAGQKEFIPHFMAFKAKVDQITELEDRQGMIEAACETMGGMAKIYGELSKLAE